jgi:dipeptidyl aminopeptidase/acylaminoacyl peptidase
LLVEGVPDAPPAMLERIEPYQNARSATLLDFEPSGRGLLVSTRFGDVPQVHRVAGAGLDREQLTFYREPIVRAATDPRRGNSGFYFAMDTGGSEAYQLYWFDRVRGQRQLLSDGRSRNEGLIVSHAGGQIAFSSTRRNGADFDIYTLAGDDPAATKRVATVQGQWNATSWSPDDTQLLLQNYVSINESHLYVLDLATGERRELNPAPGKPIAYGSPVFAASRRGAARGIYFASDEDREFLGLTYLDLKSGRKTLLRPDLAWDVTAIAVSDGGDWLAYTTNAGGTEQLYLASTAASPTPARAVQIKVPVGVINGLEFDRSGTRLGFSMSTSDSPGDVYVVDVSTRSVQRWTYSEVGGLPRAGFVVPQLIQYPTFDQRQIPAWIYRPARPSRAKLPVVVLIHGGPEGQSMAGWSAQVQYWVNELGVAVVAPNVRGSSGYGKSYLRLDNGMQREDSVADIGALLDWLATQKDLDPERVAVYGGSYGGYMVLASLARYGARLRCGVDMVGISNFVTFLERTEPYRRDLRRKEYGDEREPAMRAYLQSIAPTANANKIKAPLLVAQGQNDPRVPAFEAEQIVATARKNGNAVWYILASDEGHGFQKKANRDYFWSAVSQFFEKHLLP